MTETQVREQVVRYLAGREALAQLDAALAPVAWSAEESEATRSLVNAVELRLDEYSSGHCTEDELRAALRPFVTKYSVFMIVGQTTATVDVQTSASSSFSPTSPVMTMTPTYAGTGRAEAL